MGDIKPENVFISSDERVKVGSLTSFPYERTNYAKFIDKKTPFNSLLLAPEDLVSASSKLVDNKNNLKSEVFSIGATVLSAGILDNLSSLYDYPNNSFNSHNLSAKTVQWLEHPYYSEIFKSVVLNLVNPDAEKRISIEELWDFLSKYQTSILSKEQFLVMHPPESLLAGVSILRSKVG